MLNTCEKTQYFRKPKIWVVLWHEKYQNFLYWDGAIQNGKKGIISRSRLKIKTRATQAKHLEAVLLEKREESDQMSGFWMVIEE